MFTSLYYTFHAPVDRSLPSTSNNNKSPKDYFTQIDSKKLTDDFVDHKPHDINVTYCLTCVPICCMRKIRFGGCFKLLSCVGVWNINFRWGEGGKNSQTYQEVHGSFQSFFDILQIFCRMCTASGHDPFGQGGECINWKWIDTIYSQHFKLKFKSISNLLKLPRIHKV